jgi:hypothetical protein
MELDGLVDPSAGGWGCVTVLGMHRSGTSAVAQLLHGNGFFAGASADLMPANFSNKYGHFEHHLLHKLNEPLLSSLGGSWSSPPPLSTIEEAKDQLRDRIATPVRSLIDDLAQGGPVVLKDPRITLLLPVWASLLPGTTFAVCVRNPVAVAQSMQARNGTPLLVGLAMWEVYNAAVLRWAPMDRTVFINSGMLREVEYRRRLVGQLRSACGAPARPWKDTFDVEAFHASLPAWLWGRMLTPQQAALFRALSQHGGPSQNECLNVSAAQGLLAGYAPSVEDWEQRVRINSSS